MAEKFILFEDAAGQLNLSVDDLKQMVDEGKIRSFMDGGKMKFRESDLAALKESLGIGGAEEEELTLAPPEDVADVPPVEAADDVPPPPPAEDEFSIEPLDDEESAVPPPPPSAMADEEEEEEVASLSDFEISADVEDEGEELGEDEAELLSVQTPGFRSYEEPQSADMLMTVVLAASVVIAAFAAVTIMGFAWGLRLESLSSLWPI